MHDLFTFTISQSGGSAGEQPRFLPDDVKLILKVCVMAGQAYGQGNSLLNVKIVSTLLVCGKFGRWKNAPRSHAGPETRKTKNECSTITENTLALEHIVSKSSGVVGSLSKPAMQGLSAAAGFWAENNTGYTDNDVAFVKGMFHVFEPTMCQSYGRSGKNKRCRDG